MAHPLEISQEDQNKINKELGFRRTQKLQREGSITIDGSLEMKNNVIYIKSGFYDPETGKGALPFGYTQFKPAFATNVKIKLMPNRQAQAIITFKKQAEEEFGIPFFRGRGREELPEEWGPLPSFD
ncbi:MAG: hypothetical protein WDZ41_04560 [Candidatus Babeliales bacterium]